MFDSCFQLSEVSLSEGVDVEKRKIIIYHTINGNKFTFVVCHSMHEKLGMKLFI